MLTNPPKGCEYKTKEYAAIPMAQAKNSRVMELFERIRWSVSPHYNDLLVKIGRPKIRKFSSNDYEAVHSAQSLLKTNIPYVMDFEHAAVFSGYNQAAFNNPAFLKNLKKILENRRLKKLLPWTNAAKASLLNFLKSEEIGKKIEVVYPVITPPEKIKKKNDNVIKFLFIGGNFYEKGGIETLMAFDKIGRKYDIELTMVSSVPERIKNLFEKNKKIKIKDRIPYEEAKKLYEQSHIFVLPTHMDTFGFVIPEALSYGLPVIAEDSFSRPELVAHEKSGLLIKSYYSCFDVKGNYIYPTNIELHRNRLMACMNPPKKYVAQLVKSMERFILDSRLRNKCSENARKETTEGKFSPRVWKEKIGRIYREAINNREL